jgi:hypothetical protein
VPVGWQEGQEVASRRIEQLEGGRCRGVTFTGLNFFLMTTHECGRWVPEPAQADYVAIYVTNRQTMRPAVRAVLIEGRRLVSVVRIRGIRYVELWRR